MTYDSLEIDATASRPVELYTFSVGTSSYTYTSSEDELTVDAVVYTPIAISRDPIPQGAAARDQNVSVKLPSDDPVVQLYYNKVPGQTMSVTIQRLQRTLLTETVVIFKGKLLKFDFEENGFVAVAQVKPFQGELDFTLPREKDSTQCNAFLYDNECTVVKAAFTVTDTISGQVGRIITVPDAALQADGWFEGGELELVGQNERRLIVGHTGAQITVLFQFNRDVTGDAVNISAGCAHDVGTCEVKFGNKPNFRGSPYVPDRNPFLDGLE